MNSRSFRLILLSLPCLAIIWLFWPHSRQVSSPSPITASSVAAKPAVNKPASSTVRSGSTAPLFLFSSAAATNSVAAGNQRTNKLSLRLTNTTKSLRELSHDAHAILLANALIDTRGKLNLVLPKNLQSKGDPGAYIVQANGPINATFRTMLAQSGAQIVSYIPNNAYLVRASAGVAAAITSSGLAGAVLPYEPYYKVSSSLLTLATEQQSLPPGQLINLGLFDDTAAATEVAVQKLGGNIIGSPDRSPFGPILRVLPGANWTALAQLPGVQVVEPSFRRRTANDLARVTMGVAVDTLTNMNYLNLYGSNVLVEVNDSGIDATHPDFTLGGTLSSPATPGTGTRIIGDSAGSLTDTEGHGTHVAGIIAGNGDQSLYPTNVGVYASGSISNADFRGKAPLAKLYSVGFLGNDPAYGAAVGITAPDVADMSDYYLQTTPALTNALISNNSWTYAGDTFYDLAAAAYDGAVRDALPFTPGSQPVLFVFAAGNDGGGDSDGSGGSADTVESPGTGKNVITVGALEELRNITNIVTDANGNSNAIWQGVTDTGDQVASFSARGNVEIGVEGDSGRFKPDVVAPGTFVVSTRSSQWDEKAYYNPTNYGYNTYTGEIATTNNYAGPFVLSIPENAVGVRLTVTPNKFSPVPFPPNMAIYVSQFGAPVPGTPGTYDFVTSNDVVSIPTPDGGVGYLTAIQGGTIVFDVADSTNVSVNFNLTEEIITTNDAGNYFEVLSNLNDTLGPFYRYESGTSMAAPAVSGVLALIQDFFTNDLHTIPSPALLKAMLINGARAVGNYQFSITNAPNDQGWGLVNLPTSLPSALTNLVTAPNPPATPFFFLDQSPTNALATGDSQTFKVTVDPAAVAEPMRVTLTWTDPPGDPAAAFKLVNNLDIIITNLDTGDVYYGNNFSTSGHPNFSVAAATNVPPNLDVVNNVKNIYIQPTLGTNYTVTVLGRNVNVNAVNAHPNNVVQDFALVISAGDGAVSNALTVVMNPVVSNPTLAQTITFVTTTNTPLFNQLAGENTPLLGTNSVGVSTNSSLATNGLVTIGMTNQWHFYVVTNFTTNIYAAFITFFPSTLSLPSMGVFADSAADATRPEGDIDLYVANEPGLTNLDPVVISNCINGVGGDAVSAGPGGTEFVAYSNSVKNQVYYIGVKSEDHLATSYGFLPVFSAYPFSTMNPDGSESVNGLTLPVNIPDGTPKNPGISYTFALALYPMTVNVVIETNGIAHQNYGDLFGQMTHASVTEVPNNHDGLRDTTLGPTNIYFDAGYSTINFPGTAGSSGGSITVPSNAQPSDGPGTLANFTGQQAIGPWILTEVDNSFTQTGSVAAFGLRIYPHTPAQKGITVTIAGFSGFYDFIDVPAGVTNLTLSVTNLSLAPDPVNPLQVYLKFGAYPSPSPIPTVFDQSTVVSNGVPPGGSVSVGPTSIPPIQPGRYYFEIYNPSPNPATVYLIATLDFAAVFGTADFTSPGNIPLVDDAVMTNTIVITNTENIFSAAVGVVIDHPRVSDLTLTLLSPAGQRYVLFENRGGPTATNLGHLNIITNFFGTVSSGSDLGDTNVLGPVPPQGTILIDYDFFNVPDQIDVYYAGVDIFSRFVNGAGQFVIPYGPGGSTNITIVMDQGGDPAGTSIWTYTPQVVAENYTYLTFSDDTNFAQIPIKFAIPPFDLTDLGTNFTLCDFELGTNRDYLAPTNIADLFGGWNLYTNIAGNGTNILTLTNNEVSVITDPNTAYDGTNFLALANGSITRLIPTVPTREYTVSFSYRGPGIAGWWRGEGNATDSSDPETNGNNGQLLGRFNFPAGVVGQAFQMTDQGHLYQFAGTNNYVQIPQSPSRPSSPLNVGAGGGFTIEGWINPTNLYTQEPLVEWLARVTTNTAVTNIVIRGGPFLNRATGHYYYLLGQTNWATSEIWATNMGGHLVTINDANEQNWVYDTFADYAGTNHNLWIGLNDAVSANNYVWSSGQITPYVNWQPGQPDNCNGAEHYAVMLGATNAQPGFWRVEDQNGDACGVTSLSGAYGVVELDDIPTNGVQFWVSVTNSPATGNSILASNGCLYANLVDLTNGFHEIWSVPGLVQSNLYQHVALTYSTNSGIATFYYDGTNVCSTNLGAFIPKTTGDVLLGKDMSRLTNNFYSGQMDEMSIYRRCLSDAEIAAIYQLSAPSTNGFPTNGPVVTIGKFDSAYNPAISLAEAKVTLAGRTSFILGDNTNWQRVNYSFVASTNATLFQFTGLEPGMLLDGFTVSETALGNLYYQPEQPLDTLTGTSAAGAWTLEIQDNRAGDTNSLPRLVSWQLQFVLQTNTPVPITLNPEMPGTNTVPPGQIAYFYVPIPDWAGYATNILVSATSPVNLLFNPTNLPTGTGPGDLTLLANSTATVPPVGVGVIPTDYLQTNTLPLTTNYYYLGVKNNGTVPAKVVVRVDFDITSLSNSVPVAGTLATNQSVRYFSFDVSSNNPVEATFQLLKLTGNADLVVSSGTPLPNLTNSAYGSFNISNVDENIYVQTNTLPVPLAPGHWYLGVFRRDAGPVSYSILAKELDAGQTNVIVLTNNVPFNFTAGPGAALTNFFRFTVTNASPEIHFELYNMTGNGDLTVQSNALPLAPPFYQSGQEAGQVPEFVYLRTNNVLTNMNADWYIGVPNHETNAISYTILAVNDSLLITNTVIAFPGAVGAGSYTLGGHGSTNIYHVTNLSDDGPGSLRYGVNTLTNSGNIVFDVSGNIGLLSPLIITNSYLTISGQTAPGDGVTLQNFQTLLSGAHDVIIRYLRFRPGLTTGQPQFLDTFKGPTLNPIWQTNFPNPAYSGSPPGGASELATYLGAPNYSFQTVGTNTVLRLTNEMNSLQRVGWATGTSFKDNDFSYDVRFNTLSQDVSNSIDGFIEIWIIDAADSNRYDTVSLFGGSYDGDLRFFAGSSIDGSVYEPNFNYQNNTWYHLVLQGTAGQNIRASIYSDTGTELVGTTLSHTASTFSSGFRLGLSQLVGDALGVYPVDVAIGAVQLTTILPASPTGGDSLALTNASNVVIDHVSASWSTNTVMAVLNSSNITVQWSVISDSLHDTNGLAGQGSILRFGNGSLSFNHNLYADNYVSSPELGDNLTVDFVNNVIYNWGLLPGWSLTNDPVAYPNNFTNVLNYACNYLIATTNSMTNYIAFWGGSTNTWIFQTNNFIDDSTNFVNIINGVTNFTLNGANTGWDMFTNLYTPFGRPFPLPYPGVTNGTLPSANAEEAYVAYEKVLDFAGDQLSRDRVDLNLIHHVRQQTNVAFISSQSQAGGWPTLSSQPNPLDTDQDGIPDYWETTFGLNPTNAADGVNIVTNTGYTELETYLNWLAGPHALTTMSNTVSVDLFHLAGGTGRLSFSVTNALNGTVTLTNDVDTFGNVIRSNTIAIFTPTNALYYSSFTNPASFDFYVTNNDTVAWFGPVTVSVVVTTTNLAVFPPVIQLTNGVPFTVSNDPVYGFSVTDSPGSVVFQLYNLNGIAGLVLQTNGVPVAPDYLLTSGNASTNAAQILVQTNFALTNYGGTAMRSLNAQWFVGVTNNTGTNPFSYTVVAREIPVPPTIIRLTNAVPFTFTAGPGAALTNFFRFSVGDSPGAVQFQLYNQSGNGDLTVQTNALPYAPENYQISQQSGSSPEFIQVATNNGPASLNAEWFLAVPNNDPGTVTYTILAQEFPGLPPGILTTNTLLTNSLPPFSTNYFLVNVPQYAIVATNTLVSASGPVDLWYSTNLPPTVASPNDVQLFSTATSGSKNFNLTGSPQLVPGSFYYLAVVNSGATPVTDVLEVNFELSLPVPSTPVVTTVAANNITAFTATLNASVIPEGATTAVYFAYGLTTNYGSFSTKVLLTNSLYSTFPVAIGVTSLLPGNIYHFQAIGSNSLGVAFGLDLTFTNPPAAPAVSTVAASGVSATGATLHASVNPNGAAAAVWFAYGTNTSYGQLTSPVQLTTGLNTLQPISTGVSGLRPGVIYHFRAIGTNIIGTGFGLDLTFTNPPAAPTVTTLPAQNITATSAQLRASVVPNGAATTVLFAYGTDTNYGSYSATTVLGNNLTIAQAVALNVSSLLPGVTYHFQAIGSNSVGVTTGADLTFTTPITAPTVITLAATGITSNSAVLPALVTPNGDPATVYFAYGTTTNYTTFTTTTLLSGGLNTAQLVTSGITGLVPDVIYHYQAVAYNSFGTNYGADLTFTTQPTQPVSFDSIIATNGGYLLSWYAPTNEQFQVQWAPALPVTNWFTFTNLVVYTGPVTATNGLFTYFDNGSQSGGFSAIRFYRLTLVPAANSAPPVLPVGGSVYRVNPFTTLVVTNTATDVSPAAVLTYSVTGTLSGTNLPAISTNGIVTWTPTLAQTGLTNLITTVVTDNGVIPLSSTNSFTVIVNPVPFFSSVNITVDGVTLKWIGAASNQFQVGWTTNLLTPWTYVPVSAPYFTSPTTNFSYQDTNALGAMKFYKLRQLP